MSNSVDPDETAQYEPSHLDPCCLKKPVIIACGSDGIKEGRMEVDKKFSHGRPIEAINVDKVKKILKKRQTVYM